MVVSGSDESKQIYWTVNQHNEVMGTEQKEQASLFHFTPAGMDQSPSEFMIRYDKQEKGQGTLHYFLQFDANIFGSKKEPLELIQELGDRFTIQGESSLTYLCTSVTKTLQDWIEGQALYLRCSRHSMFKMNGYVGMRPRKNRNETHYTHETTGMSVLQKEESNTQFHLMAVEELRRVRDQQDHSDLVDGECIERKRLTTMDSSLEIRTPKFSMSEPKKRTKSFTTSEGTVDTQPRQPGRGEEHQTRRIPPRREARPLGMEGESPQQRTRSKTISGVNREEARRTAYTSTSRVRARSSSIGGAGERSRRHRERGSTEGDLQRAVRRARAKRALAQGDSKEGQEEGERGKDPQTPSDKSQPAT